MNDDYLWDKSGPPDPEVARLEELLRPLGQQEATVRLPPSRFALRRVSPKRSEDGKPDTTYISLPTSADDAGVLPQSTQRSPFDKPVLSERLILRQAQDERVEGLRASAHGEPVEPRGLSVLGRERGLFTRSEGLRYVPALAAAALIAIVISGWWLVNRSRPTRPGWEVTRVEGSPTISSRRIGSQSQLPVGDWLETNEQSKASISVPNVGRVEIEPRTRVGLVSARAGDYRLQLTRGTLHAVIWAPPGQFFVETPSSLAVDLGCAYTLNVDEAGNGLVHVTAGWVGFEWQGRESFVPAGSLCVTRPGVGPGTPFHQRSSPAVRAALETIDFSGGSPDMSAALGRVLEESRERDEVMLWHLLTRVPVDERDRVFDRLAHFVPPPPGVTREGIRAGRRDMLDEWWDALGLGTASWWRTWKQPWQGSPNSK